MPVLAFCLICFHAKMLSYVATTLGHMQPAIPSQGKRFLTGFSAQYAIPLENRVLTITVPNVLFLLLVRCAAERC